MEKGNIMLKKSLLLLSTLLCISGYSAPALAACPRSGYIGTTDKFHFAQYHRAAWYTSRYRTGWTTITWRRVKYLIWCTGIYSYVKGKLVYNTFSAYGNHVYDTNVMGIGIRINSYASGSNTPGNIPIRSALTEPAKLWFGRGIPGSVS